MYLIVRNRICGGLSVDRRIGRVRNISFFIRPTIWTPRHANNAKSTGARIEPDCRRPTGECNYAIGSRGTVQRRRRNLDIARYIIGTSIIIIIYTVRFGWRCLAWTKHLRTRQIVRRKTITDHVMSVVIQSTFKIVFVC